MDIPDRVAAQLGNRIQHGLRAFTPKELKTVAAVADSFRQTETVDMTRAIQELKVGQAVVSTLDQDGTPKVADIVTIWPPKSHLGTIDSSTLNRLLNNSELMSKYETPIDRESAHEMINAQIAAKEQALLAEAERVANEKEMERLMKEQAQAAKKQAAKPNSSYRRSDSPMDRLTKNLMSSVGRELGRAISRGLTGILKNK